MQHTAGPGVRGRATEYTLSAVETRQVENWSKYWVLHKIWRANIFSGREYQLQYLHPLQPVQQSWTEFTPQMQISFIMASYLFPNNQCFFIHTSCKISNVRFALYIWTTWKKELKCSPHAPSSDYTRKLTNELSVRGKDACGSA